jgi:radical SAM superfamily enzyme YgiQ (UPF0313 family)
MKFLFITDNFIMEQLGIMYIAATLRNAGVDVILARMNDDPDTIVKNYKPDIIGYSVITGSQDKFLRLNSDLKKKHKFISIMGGPHPTFFPEVVMNPDLDYVLRGEGEAAVLEFISYIKGEKKIEDVHNLSYKVSEKACHNPLTRLIEDLDSIIPPERLIFSAYPEIENVGIKHFIAGRGCPFGCSYCFNEQYYALYKNLGKRVRFRSVINLISEIKDVIKSSQVKLVYFQDDTFIIDKKWLKEFAQVYKKEINLPYHCHIRANLFNEEIASLLQYSNCYSVHIAVEAGNDYLRNNILKRGMKKNEILDSCRLLKKYGIKFMLQNIIGLPEGDLKADLETLELNLKCAPTYSWVSIYQPYPGTPLAQHCINKGLFNGNFNSLKENFFDATPLNFSNAYKQKVENLQKIFFLIVKFPILYYSKLYKLLLFLPRNNFFRKILKDVYLRLRRKADYELFGLRL